MSNLTSISIPSYDIKIDFEPAAEAGYATAIITAPSNQITHVEDLEIESAKSIAIFEAIEPLVKESDRPMWLILHVSDQGETRKHRYWNAPAMAIEALGLLDCISIETTMVVVDEVRDIMSEGQIVKYGVEAVEILQAAPNWRDVILKAPLDSIKTIFNDDCLQMP